MPAHIHVGVVDFAVFVLFYLILAFFIRYVQTQYTDTAVGKALAYLHG